MKRSLSAARNKSMLSLPDDEYVAAAKRAIMRQATHHSVLDRTEDYRWERNHQQTRRYHANTGRSPDGPRPGWRG